MIEHFFTCPYCWKTISMLIDTSIIKQSYIEDCEVCCNPMQISAQFLNSELIDFQVINIE
ncbi:CPXCG motif-containing cysteine-rich protein [Flavivirga jejuensis]|uniref:CPXCG motif-containing cysteine-rich protein n=1 Tax=Flavivirga jejuensis TaxID=870487 RepID=A0ABT8WMP1_9FLAO|nr:CPXCG motif-containing cysteine-rich protein [Flavivirga jejuensis]MDO5974422.1 CPXCG motif-containing cysteine-rich protein [Flavivirga jejuensis]